MRSEALRARVSPARERSEKRVGKEKRYLRSRMETAAMICVLVSSSSHFFLLLPHNVHSNTENLFSFSRLKEYLMCL